jgi:hypothetical protein
MPNQVNQLTRYKSYLHTYNFTIPCPIVKETVLGLVLSYELKIRSKSAIALGWHIARPRKQGESQASPKSRYLSLN